MKARQKLRKGIILFSFFLFPAIFYYASPVVIIRATLNGIINGSFIIFILMFCLFSLFFLAGRIVAGYVLPPVVKRLYFNREIKKLLRAITLNGLFGYHGSVP